MKSFAIISIFMLSFLALGQSSASAGYDYYGSNRDYQRDYRREYSGYYYGHSRDEYGTNVVYYADNNYDRERRVMDEYGDNVYYYQDSNNDRERRRVDDEYGDNVYYAQNNNDRNIRTRIRPSGQSNVIYTGTRIRTGSSLRYNDYHYDRYAGTNTEYSTHNNDNERLRSSSNRVSGENSVYGRKSGYNYYY